MKYYLKKSKWLILMFFVIGNVISYNHAYKFTHFTSDEKRTNKAEALSFTEKIRILFLGISNPKPINNDRPEGKFETINIQSHKKLECWLIEKENHKGVIALFHGYSGSKSGNLEYSNEFNKMGYSTFLVDFMGSGGSEGNQTTIGYKESRDVKASYDYLIEKYPEEEIILFGSSMGAVAIMKSISDYDIRPTKIMIECPFGKMRTTVKKRFEALNIPSFVFADILLFYGGLQNGFNAFKHNPIEYSKQIEVPTMLSYGLRDQRVSMKEIEEIYKNLGGKKELKILENSGHENYLVNSRVEWEKNAMKFLEH